MTIHSPITRGTGSSHSRGPTFDKIVKHGGRSFLATTTMAAIFTARAEDVIARFDTELVPLLHRDGVELMLIGPHTEFTVETAAVGPGGPASRS
ncbi:MAG: hypothetical protein V4531_03805 [Actinomycetota bacterium]